MQLDSNIHGGMWWFLEMVALKTLVWHDVKAVWDLETSPGKCLCFFWLPLSCQQTAGTSAPSTIDYFSLADQMSDWAPLERTSTFFTDPLGWTAVVRTGSDVGGGIGHVWAQPCAIVPAQGSCGWWSGFFAFRKPRKKVWLQIGSLGWRSTDRSKCANLEPMTRNEPNIAKWCHSGSRATIPWVLSVCFQRAFQVVRAVNGVRHDVQFGSTSPRARSWYYRFQGWIYLSNKNLILCWSPSTQDEWKEDIIPNHSEDLKWPWDAWGCLGCRGSLRCKLPAIQLPQASCLLIDVEWHFWSSTAG